MFLGARSPLFAAIAMCGGVPLEAESVAIFAAFTLPATAAQQTIINNQVVALKASGTWALLDRLWVPGYAATEQQAKVNWISPGSDPLILSGSTRYFIPYWGFIGNGVDNEAHNASGYDTLTNYKQNAASIHCWAIALDAGVSALGTVPFTIYLDYNDVGQTIKQNGAIVTIGSTQPVDPTGLWVALRKDATDQYVYQNGSLSGSAASATNGVTTAVLSALYSANTYNSDVLAMIAVGGNTSAQIAADYAAWNTGMLAVGVKKPAISSSWAFDFLTYPTIASQSGNFYPAATFAQSTLVPDWEGLLRATVPTEVPFGGYRRVRNNVINSDAPVTQNITVPAGSYVLSFTGGTSVVCSGVGSKTLNAQGSSRVASAAFTCTAGTLVFTVTGAVTFAQLENVTNQSNQNPAEYVSHGSLPPPFHGCNADGVKYFTTQNGNTVAGEVVMAATGAALSPTTVLKGMQIMPATTNLCLQSSNFGATWAAIGTPTRVAAALSCGDVTLDLIGDDSAAALEGYSQTITFTGDGVKGDSVLISKDTSTSSVIQVLDTTASVTRQLATITWSGSVPVITMTTGALLKTDAMGDGVYRVQATTASLVAANTNSLRVYPATDAALSVGMTGNIYVGGVQCEDFDFCSMLIPTTTVTVARTQQSLASRLINTSPNAGFSTTAGTINAEVLFNTNNGAGSSIQQYIAHFPVFGSVNERLFMIRFPDTSIACNGRVSGGDIGNPNPGNLANDAIGKIAYAYGTNGANLDYGSCLNGGTVATNSAVGTLPAGINSVTIGGGGGGDHSLNGYLRKLNYQSSRISNAALQALTA